MCSDTRVQVGEYLVTGNAARAEVIERRIGREYIIKSFKQCEERSAFDEARKWALETQAQHQIVPKQTGNQTAINARHAMDAYKDYVDNYLKPSDN